MGPQTHRDFPKILHNHQAQKTVRQGRVTHYGAQQQSPFKNCFLLRLTFAPSFHSRDLASAVPCDVPELRHPGRPRNPPFIPQNNFSKNCSKNWSVCGPRARPAWLLSAAGRHFRLFNLQIQQGSSQLQIPDLMHGSEPREVPGSRTEPFSSAGGPCRPVVGYQTHVSKWSRLQRG